jgi:poly-beta-1,6-N-acetyl-D-glucosamine synthase
MTVTSICIYIFWISLGLLFYIYVGYGLLAGILGLFRPKRKFDIKLAAVIPVTVIIPAYNEKNILGEKIRNTIRALENFENSQVILITDGSSDGSAELKFPDKRIVHLHSPDRLGKSAAINKAMENASGEIIIVTDANAMVNLEAFEKLVARFSSEKTGAVSGEKKVSPGTGSAGNEGLYWKYESFLKRQSANMYSLTGAAGELLAFRKSLFKPLPVDAILDDLQLSLDIVRQGKIIDYEPKAFALEPPSLSIRDEFARKVRISAGVFQTLKRNGFVFNPFKHSIFVFQFISHRVFRWTLTIVCLILLFVSDLLLVDGNQFDPLSVTFNFCFAVQLFFYFQVVLGLVFRNIKLPGLFFIPFYFIMMNAAVAVGFFRYLGNRESVMWKKAAR